MQREGAGIKNSAATEADRLPQKVTFPAEKRAWPCQVTETQMPAWRRELRWGLWRASSHKLLHVHLSKQHT